jgi:hypothetical protein
MRPGRRRSIPDAIENTGARVRRCLPFTSALRCLDSALASSRVAVPLLGGGVGLQEPQPAQFALMDPYTSTT